MDKDKLKSLEEKLHGQILTKIEDLVADAALNKFHHGCEISHLEETVKLCHKARSLQSQAVEK